MSVAGGVDRAVDRAHHVGCRTLQIFTKNANQWSGPPIAPDVAARFRERLAATAIAPVVAHDSYLINLASPDDTLRAKSMTAFRDELDRAEQLGLMGVVTHPGAHVGSGDDAGLARVATALARLLDETATYRVCILIENTAGQGSSLGWDLRHLEALLDGTARHPRIGFCLDTCHLHAAGYDLGTDASYAAVMDEVGRRIGFERLRCLHLNDAQKPLGSRVDRHTHIGEGTLGLEPFRRILNDPRLLMVPKILETPKINDGVAEDLRNLTTLALLAGITSWPCPAAEAPGARVTSGAPSSPKPPRSKKRREPPPRAARASATPPPRSRAAREATPPPSGRNSGTSPTRKK